MSNSKVLFSLSAINTEQFATVESAYNDDCEVSIVTGFNFGLNEERSAVLISSKLNFDCNEKSFIILNTSCEFSIEPESFKSLIHEDKSIKLPKGLLTHLAVLTIGTARGILHEKLSKTDFKQFLLPTINISDLIKEDLIFSTEKK